MDIMNTPQQNNSGFSKLDDDILSIIFTMLFVSSDFRKCYKIISEINKQFYRTVLTPWWGGVGSAIDVTGLQGS